MYTSYLTPCRRLRGHGLVQLMQGQDTMSADHEKDEEYKVVDGKDTRIIIQYFYEFSRSCKSVAASTRPRSSTDPGRT